ncbi:LVIVD repeat-containing protein [Owenweeksia hongkongensis]|uniref:LVIVD repeat-containing protein n=1 Tax=Owenweeksia hongkongensis TaxID=253245 RepID=UPI000310D543|nr:hypothetical protein [Owenweeksia hongkongensis]
MKKLLLLTASILFLVSCQDGVSDTSAIPGTGQGGSLARFAISSDFMFAVNGQSLKVFSLSDPENPRLLSTQNLGVNVETIFLRDSATLFIGSTDGMFIYDISNAPNIIHLSTYRHVTSCDPVVANENYAYVTLRSSVNNNACSRGVNQLDILDISDLTMPQEVNRIPMDHPIGLGLYGDTLLVCDDGIKVFSTVDPRNPYLITTQKEIDAVDIIPYGKQMIISTSTGFEQYEYHKGELKFLSKI